MQHHRDAFRLPGKRGVALVRADQNDVRVPQQMRCAVDTDLQPAAQDRQQLQFPVPVVVVGADMIDVLLQKTAVFSHW